MKNVRILMVPRYQTNEELEAMEIVPDATVEAEYGANVIKGTQVTLAHHTKEYENNPAPCNAENVPVLEDGATIVISHIDLDTLGGIAALLGVKPEDPEFWKAAEFLDLNGIHHLHEVPEGVREQYLAYEAWGEQHRGSRITEVTDVTESVLERIGVVTKAIEKDPELVANGLKWDKEMNEAIEGCLVYENDDVRVFNSPMGVFCSAAYYSPNLKKIVPATVTFNGKFKSVTMALADGGKGLKELGLDTSREFVQKLWGPEAGGHPGIAGSPRGQEMTEKDMYDLAQEVEKQMRKARDMKKNKINLRSISDNSQISVSKEE